MTGSQSGTVDMRRAARLVLELLRDRWWTHQQLADEAGVKVSTLRDFLYGRTTKRPRYLPRIERVFGLAPGSLMLVARGGSDAFVKGAAALCAIPETIIPADQRRVLISVLRGFHTTDSELLGDED